MTPGFLNMSKLAKLAGIYPADALPRDFHQSHPVPVPAGEIMHVAFFYGRAATLSPQAGFQLQAPSYLAFLQADTGEFEEVRAVTPADFGQVQPADEWIGRYVSPAERLAPEFVTQLVRMYQLYDAILPRFAERESAPASGLVTLVTEFRMFFWQVAEVPWQPYYRLQGAEFFSWLNQIAGPVTA